MGTSTRYYVPTLCNTVLRLEPSDSASGITAWFFNEHDIWTRETYPTIEAIQQSPHLRLRTTNKKQQARIPCEIADDEINPIALQAVAYTQTEGKKMPPWLRHYEHTLKPKPDNVRFYEQPEDGPKIQETKIQALSKIPWPEKTGAKTPSGNYFTNCASLDKIGKTYYVRWQSGKNYSKNHREIYTDFYFLTLAKLPYVPLLGRNMRTYCFNQNYRWARANDLNKEERIMLDAMYYYSTVSTREIIPDTIDGIKIHHKWFQLACRGLNDNDTIDDLILRYNFLCEHDGDITAMNETFRLYMKPVYGTGAPISPDVERMIASIGRPYIERETGNKNTNTFDFIRIRITLVTRCPDKAKFVKEHISDFIDAALWKIEGNRYYKRYGVPINYLRLTNAVITHTSELELLFTLPDV